MGLLDLIEQHYRVGPPPDLLRQLPPLLVAHIARGRAHQAAGGVSLCVLRHVDADQGLLLAEHGRCQSPAEFRLAHPAGPQEQEAPCGPVRLLQPYTASTDGSGHGPQGLVLTHQALLQRLLQIQKALALVLGQPLDRNTRPLRRHRRHILLCHCQQLIRPVLRPALLSRPELGGKIVLHIPQAGRRLEVLAVDGLLLLPSN